MRLRRVFLFAGVRALSIAAMVYASAAVVASGEGAPAASTRAVTCSFSNPGYSGWCRQTETVPNGKSSAGVCGEILKCLNDTRCTRTYCTATEIRGNWKLEKVVTRSRPPATKTASLR
ncbi:MAG: hypothetical protein M3167_06815 [Acidobacteriota bacterium]|nr:hypothetical protein [Acidobacteriota bacterium]